MMHLAIYLAALEKRQGLNVNELSEIADQDPAAAQRELYRLCKLGKLFKLPSTPYVRHFSTAEIRDSMVEQVKADAIAHVAAVKERKRVRDNKKRRNQYHAGKASAPKPARKKRSDAGKRHKTTAFNPSSFAKETRPRPAKIDTRPIDDSKAIRTVWPTPPGRYEVSKDFKGPFSLVGVGRDATTGQAWRD
jgi:hypothetical protein